MALGLAAWWWTGRGERAPLTESADSSEEPGTTPVLQPKAPGRPRDGGGSGSGPGGASPACRPSAVLRCHQGDVWSASSCGELEERAEDCGDHLCREGRCDVPPDVPCEEPPEGRCDGQVVVLCHGGRKQRVDCGAKGLSCAIGEEGAQCVPLIPPEQRCSGPARCEKETLLSCREGRRERTDCTALRAHCLMLPGAREASCVRVEAPPVQGCGPCGCQADGSGETECDGQDEDQDRRVDEGIDCGPVPIVAFVVTDERGESSYTREDIEIELARVNRAFAGGEDESSLAFELDQVVEIADSRLLALEDKQLMQLISDARVHPPRDEFYIPIVFTNEVLAGGRTPKFGLSTLPNGTCGGMQQRAGPEVGMVVVGKVRAPTTVAHEIGHFLGLCHTHADETPLASVALTGSQAGGLVACGEVCRAEGDGLCDTPFDPGPELCSYDPACETLCRGGDQPDATNLMSYYTSCRSHFSKDQVRLMQHTLALRRAWHPCVGARCACQLGGSECPSGMSCRPRVLAGGETAGRCTLDGPRPAAADCDDTSQCGQGALCLHETSRGLKRCARACQLSSSTCDCVVAGQGLSVCREDMGG